MFGTSQEPQLIRSNHALVTHLLPKAHVDFSGERIVAMARDAASTFIPPSAVSERDHASLVFCKGSQDRVIEFAHGELLPNRLQGGRPCVGLSTLSTILPLPFVDVHIAGCDCIHITTKMHTAMSFVLCVTVYFHMYPVTPCRVRIATSF